MYIRVIVVMTVDLNIVVTADMEFVVTVNILFAVTVDLDEGVAFNQKMIIAVYGAHTVAPDMEMLVFLDNDVTLVQNSMHF